MMCRIAILGRLFVRRRRPAHGAQIAADERGTTAIEYGIVLPALMLFFLGIVDMGRLMWMYNTLSRAASAASRCASINTTLCGTASAIQSDAVNEAWGMTVPASTFSVSYPSCGVQVTATYSFTFYTPGLSTITLAPSACMTVLHS